MKKILIIIQLLFYSELAAETKCGDDQPYSPFSKLNVKYHNVIPYATVKKGTMLTEKDYIGKIREYPKPLTLDDNTYYEGEEAYKQGDYRKAAGLFVKVYNQDKRNPFAINALARTLYKIDKQRSRSINAYIDLMKIIETGYMDSEKYSVVVGLEKGKTIVIDPWFLESYWKLGTLYLDYQEFDKAVLEMSKMYYYEFKAHKEIPEKDRGMALQLFSYLTEAHFHLKNKNANQYFYCRTKEIDPSNTYVDTLHLE